MNSARSSEPPDEPYLRSQISLLSPASPKPLNFPQPTNIPVLNNMMDIGFNQTEAHMTDQAMRNTELRPDAWRDPKEERAKDPSTDNTAALPPSEGVTAKADGEAQDASIRPEDDITHSHSNGAQSAQTSTNGFHPFVNSQPQADVVVSEHTALKDESMPTSDHSAPVTASDVRSAPTSADVQAILNSLQTPVARSAEAPVATIEELTAVPNAPSAVDAQAHPPTSGTELSSPLSASLAAPSTGLPPRPPPQDQPSINPNFANSNRPGDHHPHVVHAHGRSNSSTHGEPNSGYQVHNSSGSRQHRPASNTPIESRREIKLAAGEIPSTDDQPWTAEIQKKYDHFLEEEKRYVSEANWSQFPSGSRLFIGNLSSEKVTKRDIFHVFHTHGQLAQISIKQAFGFVQFLSTQDARRALSAEEGRQVRDKRIHLEISKDQTKGGDKKMRNDRRSRSPDHGRGRAGSYDNRYVPNGRGRGSTGFGGGRGRDGRDGYRGGYRSPSPRGYRGRYDDRYRTRSRSPQRGNYYRRNSEDDLPLPQRPANEVPEVQIIALDRLEPDFLSWVRKAFEERGIRVDILKLAQHINEDDVVKRQIMEGVLAVSKLRRANQDASKIGLTIFERVPGTQDINFKNYEYLDPSLCVALVLEAKAKAAQGQGQGRPASTAGPYNGQHHQGSYGAPTQQYGYQQQPQVPPQGYPGYPPGYQPQQTTYGMPGPPQPTRQDPNLESILSTLNQVSPTTPQTAGFAPNGYPPQSYPPQGYPPQAYPAQQYAAQGGPYAPTRNMLQPPASAGKPGPGQTPNMQDILARLNNPTGTYSRR